MVNCFKKDTSQNVPQTIRRKKNHLILYFNKFKKNEWFQIYEHQRDNSKYSLNLNSKTKNFQTQFCKKKKKSYPIHALSHLRSPKRTLGCCCSERCCGCSRCGLPTQTAQIKDTTGYKNGIPTQITNQFLWPNIENWIRKGFIGAIVNNKNMLSQESLKLTMIF